MSFQRAFWILGVSMCFGLPAAAEDDPLTAYPENYELLLENEHVRVLDFKLRKGAREDFHTHPAHVAYILSGFKIMFRFPDGRTALRETKDGDVLYSEAVTHASENVGDGDAHGILVEMKDPAAKMAPTASIPDWLTAVTFITGKSGREEELKTELMALSAPTRAEPGAIAYDLYQSKEKPNEFLRFEIWKSEEALEAHKRTPHIQGSFQKRQEQGWKTEITLWKRVPGDEVAASSPFVRLDPRFDEIVPRTAKLEKLVDGFSWVEGPVWSRSGNFLLFSDIPNNRIVQLRAGHDPVDFLKPSGYTGKEPFSGREPGSNGLTFDPKGRLVLAEHGDRRVSRLEADGSKTTLVDRYQGKRLNSPNDVVFRSNGDLYFTDPPFGLPTGLEDPEKELDFQGVYRLSTDGTLTLLTRDLAAPNGIAFSPDEKNLYVSDSLRRVWMVYDVKDDGSIANGRVLFDASRLDREAPGVPDGMKVDRTGNLFAAAPGGLYVISPDGALLGKIDLGAATGNCAFGEDGSTLFITSSTAVYRLRLD